MGKGDEDENKKRNMTKEQRKELAISCMLNTEVGAVLAVIRRGPETNAQFYHPVEENCDPNTLTALKSLRSLIFNPQQEWRTIDPSMYISPFLDVLQSDDVPASATGVALSSVLKILRLEIFDEKTPGARDIINSAVTGITGCRLEKTDPVSEDAVMMKILQALTAIMRHRASVLLTDDSVCTVVNTCFQVVQQSASRGDLLQRSARYTMHELIQMIYSRLPEIEVKDWEDSESDTEDSNLDAGYGIRAAIDIFHFLCSLLNVVEVIETEGLMSQTADENVQLFSLVLINSAIELSGDSIGKHPKLLRMVQDDLFHHLIHYGTCSSPLVLSMICSSVLNIYHFLRRSVRLQMEAFFSFVLFKVASQGTLQLSELFHSISSNAITIFAESGTREEMNPNRWIQLVNQAKIMNPFVLCDFDRRLGRDMFAAISGPCVATLAAIFEHADEEEILHECVEACFSIARIAQYGLEDTLDELLCSFCKFTTLLNPYASPEETLYAFSNDMKPKMATLAVFTIANTFRNSIKGGWRTIIDCLLKLKRLKLLPQSVVEPDKALGSSSGHPSEDKTDSGVVFPSQFVKQNSKRPSSGITGRFLHFLSMESVEESLNLGLSEFEQNLKIIQQCNIGSIFSSSSSLPDESLLNLGRSLISAAAGKVQKFSTPVEEEETVAFCWDLIFAIASTNDHRFTNFWPHYHEYLLGIAQYPLFSPIPFAEKAIVSLMKICLKLLSADQPDKVAEELIFKSINLMWKLEKEILDTCCELLIQLVSKILTEYPSSLQTSLGWKSVMHLLSVTGRHPETYDQGVEALTKLMADRTCISRTNYVYCIDCAFGFVALKNSPLEKNVKLMDLMSESVNLLVQWSRAAYYDPGSNVSLASNVSSSSQEDIKAFNYANFTMNLFIKLGEAFRKTSLARREEIRNHAILSLERSFGLAEELCFTPANCINCFNLVIFAMVDDLHEKMLEYSRRENAERETRSMEGTLKLSMEVLTEVYLQFLKPIAESPNFRQFWLGILRRMDTCMKADLGEYGQSKMQDVIPELLKRIISIMKEKDILVPTEGDDLWEITYIQIQWIAPSVKDELFPDVGE